MRDTFNDRRDSIAEFDGFYEFAEFYYQRISSSWPEYIAQTLTQSEPWQSRTQIYSERQTTVQSLNPPQCTNDDDWTRTSVTIDGIQYQVPVFTPRFSHVPAWYYTEHIRAGFEILKAFMRPEDVERLLRPADGTPDMAFYVGDGDDPVYGNARATFEACELRTEDRGGEYSSLRNHITITESGTVNGGGFIPDREDPLPFWASIHMGGPYLTFFHEIGHAIYYRLLGTTEHQQVRRMYRFARERVEHSRQENVRYIPLYFLLGGGGDQYRDYGMTNEREYFSDWFFEYVLLRILGHEPSEGPMLARYQIMEEFLSSSGINLDAFSIENMEEAFRNAGTEVDLAPRQSGFSLTLPHMGVQSFSGDVNGTSGDGLSILIGLQLGYFSRNMPTGFVGGLGGLVDFSPGIGGELQEDYMIDFGAYGRLGYNTGPIDLFIEPALGGRYMTLDGSSAMTFWLGGQVGLSFVNGGLSLFAMTRISPDNWQSFGCGIALDLPTIVRE
jgi:hypothetical protein